MKPRKPLKRTPFKRPPPGMVSGLRRTGPLKAGTTKIKRAPFEWDVAKAYVHERSMGYCEAIIHAPGCKGLAQQVHHRKLRSQGGSDHPTNLLDVSQACHRRFHQNPEWAYACGYLVHSYDTPELVPLRAAPPVR